MAVAPLIGSAPRFTAAFWVSFAAWMTMEAWVWVRERGVRGESHDRGSKIWIVATIWIGVYAAVGLMLNLPAAAFRHGAAPLFWVGIGLLWAGVGLRWWAIHTLGRFFNTSVILQEGHRMITSGPYRVVRNPSYSGALLSFVGTGLCFSNWASLAVIVVFTLAGYWRRITVEQQALLQHFGDPYREYIGRTWALIPFVW